MKKKDWEQLKAEGPAALAVREKDMGDALWKLRLQKSTGQLENPAKLRSLRRDIARVKTIVRQSGEQA